MTRLRAQLRTRRLICIMAAAIAAALIAVTVVEAATTSWDTLGKYSRARLHYSIDGGSGDSTDWTFKKREYSGQNGCTGVDSDKWRLYAAADFASDGQSWHRQGNYGSGPWRYNDCSWRDYSFGSRRSVSNYRGISLVTDIEHHWCSPHPIYGCEWQKQIHTLENTVFNT